MSPLVSVVTPTLDQAAWIEQTLTSVRDQRYPHVEHIVVDGGSTDGTLDILRRHERPGLRWVSEPDAGMYDAVNKGLAMASGEVLAYLNSDDRYLPWTVEKVVDAFAADPDADLVYGDVVNVVEGEATGMVEVYPAFRPGWLRRTSVLAQPTVFWRRRVYEAHGGFDTSLRLVADCDYWMRAGERGRVRKVAEVLAVERDHPDAKRFAQAEALEAEMREVRARYVDLDAPLTRLLSAGDRVAHSLARRVGLLRLLLGPGYTESRRHLDVSAPAALATMAPLRGRRSARRVVRLTDGSAATRPVTGHG